MASPISKSTFAGGITTLHIGPKHVVFNVHSSLLTSRSSYFADVLSEQQHNSDSPIELLNENPNIFHLLVNWLYHQRIINTSFSCLEPDWQDLIHLWLLADRVQIRELQRDVIACCRRKIEPRSNSNPTSSKAICPLDMIEYAYKNSRLKSPLRLVICEVWVENARYVKDLNRLMPRFPPEFLEDVCFTVVRKAQGAEQHDDEAESLSRIEEANGPITENKVERREKETTPAAMTQPYAEVELNQPQYGPPVENIVPIAPVVESFEQTNDHLFEPDSATAATSFQGEEPAYTSGETPPDDNRSTIYPSTQSVSSKASKKNKKNKGKNKNWNDETLQNIPEPDSFEQQVDETPNQYANSYNGNGSRYYQDYQQRQPDFDDEKAGISHQWVPPAQRRNDFGTPRNSQDASSDFSSKKNNKKKNKQQDRFHNGQQGPLSTGPRTDRRRQGDYYPPAPPSVQSYSPSTRSYSHSRHNTDGSQYQQPHQMPMPMPMPNGRKNRDRDSFPRENVPRDQGHSPRNRRKQAPGSRLDPALQPSPPPTQNGKWDQKHRRR
ncbi:hypothetical protein PISL3812_08797 [Talaromyces islandicus]|uniref:BTB domain-containing protein n=1 Tax=Talaromyces islandicus TaxID=28573 RepID=A0A0U1M822_TALIS|nr:hypothetical protein PISL3812_08797 [Talaromyces islandicus]